MATEVSTTVSAPITSVSFPALPPDPNYDKWVVLTDVSWDEYLSLRAKPANRGLRMVYAEGELAIMTLSSFHEVISLLIHDFISEWRVAKKIPVMPCGSMTLRRNVVKLGLEGDQSYYIAHEPQVRGTDIDLNHTLPPDLAIEVEHTSRATFKMSVYAKLGVPEVWRWHRETLTVYRLVDREYLESQDSIALVGFPLDQFRIALSKRLQVDETTLVTEFRYWLGTPQ